MAGNGLVRPNGRGPTNEIQYYTHSLKHPIDFRRMW
jgi:hypothetical protein